MTEAHSQVKRGEIWSMKNHNTAFALVFLSIKLKHMRRWQPVRVSHLHSHHTRLLLFVADRDLGRGRYFPCRLQLDAETCELLSLVFSSLCQSKRYLFESGIFFYVFFFFLFFFKFNWSLNSFMTKGSVSARRHLLRWPEERKFARYCL